MSRPEADAYVRLEGDKFSEVWRWTERGFDMDLMATPASSHKIPGTEVRLPFYSRYRTKACAGVDVLSQDISRLPDGSGPCFGYCFPPTSMVGVVLQRMSECKARAVVVVPDQQQTWFPLLAGATVRSLPISFPTDDSIFYRTNHIKGKVPFAFKRWSMRAVEVDFDRH